MQISIQTRRSEAVLSVIRPGLKVIQWSSDDLPLGCDYSALTPVALNQLRRERDTRERKSTQR